MKMHQFLCLNIHTTFQFPNFISTKLRVELASSQLPKEDLLVLQA